MASKITFLDERLAAEQHHCSMQIVYVDISAYTRRYTHSQLLAIKAFMTVIEQALKETARHYLDFLQRADINLRRDVLVLPSGDGAAICFPFEGIPDMHLRFARELLETMSRTNSATACSKFKKQGWCNCHGLFLLRCGISQGELVLYRDLNGHPNVAGGAINLAERVMSLAKPGQVFLTEAAHSGLVEFVPGAETEFQCYRGVTIKHGVKIDVYQCIDQTWEGLDVTLQERIGDSDDEAASESTSGRKKVAKRSSTPRKPRGQARADGAAPPDGTLPKPIATGDPEMVLVPAGTVSLVGGNAARIDVPIPSPLLVGRYQVTQGQYFAVVRHNPSCFSGDRLPVDTVSWTDAVAFCNALSEQAGLRPVYTEVGREVLIDYEMSGYRLPTEAEWEYFCRAGSAGVRYGPLDDVAWYAANSGGRTHDVGTRAPNAFGLYDVLGNVWEWCNDWHEKGYLAVTHGMYAGPEAGLERVLRGGSWKDQPECVRSSYRHRQNTQAREGNFGLRIVRRHVPAEGTPH